MIFNIQRFSLHDGPGIRTTVFMKGCNLRCFWCHNPEGLSPEPVLQFFPQKCIGCGACLKACPVGLDRAKCVGCGACAESCPAGARVLTGKSASADEIVASVLRDREFYGGDGGCTFSGGEPLLQSSLIAEAARRLKAEGVGCAIETAGDVAFAAFERVLPHLELVIIDVKHHDPELFRRYCGGNLDNVLNNLARLAGRRVWLRVPLVPGVNDSAECVEQIAAAVRGRTDMPFERAEIMPFHRLGEGKYQSLGLDYGASGLTPPDKELVSLCERTLRRGLGLPEQL